MGATSDNVNQSVNDNNKIYLEADKFQFNFKSKLELAKTYPSYVQIPMLNLGSSIFPIIVPVIHSNGNLMKGLERVQSFS